MRLILTHEQADLDALASQLGAWLLDQEALPVLPQRINRNVRAFLTIYGPQLPFIERNDLPRTTIETVTLVDTQSMVTLKGMTPQTRVHILDHHDPRSLPEDWNVTIQPTGANTTLLVEAIQERSISLASIQATLLLMGIYEDTGSLTYTRTTPRDLRAAAYLLEAGASLDIVKSHLHHPLSLAQQRLYEHLRDHAETYRIYGHNILVASGDAHEMNEELSSLAHKLRDLLEPDGLILLIAVAGGVQLIARSTDDHVDAGGIATDFGGGGHHRAAAALIKRGNLAQVHQELLEILPRYVRPAITVAQIMSGSPQLLTPSVSIEEASQRMTRYGYEGYPVIENGKVIGLLKRREVDRAISHRLNLPIRNLMDAGNVTVKPDDSIEHLQQVMVDTGWGQIPVVDSGGQITGIVTRTDLLKNLIPEPALPGYHNLAGLIEKSVPAAHLALLKMIAETAREQHQVLYAVGGFVRDLLLERPSLDFDLVVEGDAIALAKALVKKHGGRITTHARFGTAKWFLDEQRIKKSPTSTTSLPSFLDLITARTEFYTHPTALPTVERGSIKLDLHRRDFTINTLALRLDGLNFGDLHDYWGGYNDLRQGIIRVLHSISFVDDPTRILRAVRFEQRFGFRIEERTRELLESALVPHDGTSTSLLDRVSGDRIRHEIDHVLDEPNRAAILNRMDELGILKAIHSNLPWNDTIFTELNELGEKQPGPEWGIETTFKGVPLSRTLAYLVWFSHLSQASSQAVSERLRLVQGLQDVLGAVLGLRDELPELCAKPPSLITQRLDKMHPLGIYIGYITSQDQTMRDCLLAYVSHWRQIHPYTDGNSLQTLGLRPGPHYTEILSALRAGWLDGHIHSREEENKLLHELIQSKSA